MAAEQRAALAGELSTEIQDELRAARSEVAAAMPDVDSIRNGLSEATAEAERAAGPREFFLAAAKEQVAAAERRAAEAEERAMAAERSVEDVRADIERAKADERAAEHAIAAARADADGPKEGDRRARG